ncbi:MULTISPECIES: sensor domain-containing diguanylate cyclase [Pseudoalteromonas]|uniref:diguanylate cyclase n=1 Tax=Pseudoalteromonas rhizosphaerae TaxID=2518973 RepID=A0ABW8KZP2_9GAMM|nr:sensor domain-containing diguanylate cyclase [Pseudoalteromonas rhizosphaerae]
MFETKEFLKLILDTVSEHIVVINESGDIQYINQSWRAFGNQNNGSCNLDWYSQNYLRVCELAAKDDEYAYTALKGIKSVITKQQDEFYLEYPCNSDTEPRWFMMRVVPLQIKEQRFIVISHLNITERILAEQQVHKLARIDGLTQIANRRCLDDFLLEEWNRCQRLSLPLSFAMIDLDHFKMLNDSAGHLVGDECLQQVAKLLNSFSRRTSDLCARFGGEEFALVLGNIKFDEATVLLKRFKSELAHLKISNNGANAKNILTVSIGLVTLIPTANSSPTKLIEKADSLLYEVKYSGRDGMLAVDESCTSDNQVH